MQLDCSSRSLRKRATGSHRSPHRKRWRPSQESLVTAPAKAAVPSMPDRSASLTKSHYPRPKVLSAILGGSGRVYHGLLSISLPGTNCSNSSYVLFFSVWFCSIIFYSILSDLASSTISFCSFFWLSSPFGSIPAQSIQCIHLSVYMSIYLI